MAKERGSDVQFLFQMVHSSSAQDFLPPNVDFWTPTAGKRTLIQCLLFNFPVSNSSHYFKLQQTDPQRSINTLSGWYFVWSQPLPVPSLKLQRRRGSWQGSSQNRANVTSCNPPFFGSDFQMWIQVGEIWTSEVQSEEVFIVPYVGWLFERGKLEFGWIFWWKLAYLHVRATNRRRYRFKMLVFGWKQLWSREMRLFPENDDIQKELNFYKPPLYINSTQRVWHQVTTMLEMRFLWDEKKSLQKMWDFGDEQSRHVFSYVKNAVRFRRICGRNTWISQMQMAMPAMLS